MGIPKSKLNRLVSVDGRGRITLPTEARNGVDAYSIEVLKDGTIKLIPQEVVNIADAALLKSLKKSVAQAKKGQVEDVPDEWID